MNSSGFEHKKLYVKFLLSSAVIGLVSIFIIEIVRIVFNGSVFFHAVFSGIIYFCGVFASYYSQKKWVHKSPSIVTASRFLLFMAASLIVSFLVGGISKLTYEKILLLPFYAIAAPTSLVLAAVCTSPISYFVGFYILRDKKLQY